MKRLALLVLACAAPALAEFGYPGPPVCIRLALNAWPTCFYTWDAWGGVYSCCPECPCDVPAWWGQSILNLTETHRRELYTYPNRHVSVRYALAEGHCVTCADPQGCWTSCGSSVAVYLHWNEATNFLTVNIRAFSMDACWDESMDWLTGVCGDIECGLLGGCKSEGPEPSPGADVGCSCYWARWSKSLTNGGAGYHGGLPWQWLIDPNDPNYPTVPDGLTVPWAEGPCLSGTNAKIWFVVDAGDCSVEVLVPDFLGAAPVYGPELSIPPIEIEEHVEVRMAVKEQIQVGETLEYMLEPNEIQPDYGVFKELPWRQIETTPGAYNFTYYIEWPNFGAGEDWKIQQVFDPHPQAMAESHYFGQIWSVAVWFRYFVVIMVAWWALLIVWQILGRI